MPQKQKEVSHETGHPVDVMFSGKLSCQIPKDPLLRGLHPRGSNMDSKKDVVEIVELTVEELEERIAPGIVFN